MQDLDRKLHQDKLFEVTRDMAAHNFERDREGTIEMLAIYNEKVLEMKDEDIIDYYAEVLFNV